MTHHSTRPDQLTHPLGDIPAADAVASAPMPAPGGAARPGPQGWIWPSLGTALAYWLAGKLALLLAIPPGFASPIYPGAGIALAAVLVMGWRAAPGIALGALALNASVVGSRDAAQGLAWALPLVSAAGATAQAALGAWLMRRQRGPLLLGEPREVAAFFVLGAALACTVNASLSTLALAAAGAVAPAARAFTWWTWWGGDTLGVLVGTPIVLTLIGQPRAEWAARRIPVALPLLVATALLAAGTWLVARWDTQRTRNVFDGDAIAAGSAVAAHLHQALYALEALHGLHIGSADVDPDEMHRAAAPWLALPINLQALGYSERVARSAVPAFEATVSRQSGLPFRVFDRSPLAAQDTEVVAIRHIEPQAGNTGALGVNALSIPAARAAIQRAVSSDAPAATDGFRLTQESGDQTGVVIYRALYRPSPGRGPGSVAQAEREKSFHAVVFVTLRMQQSVEAAMRDVPPYLAWCLLDQQPGSPRPRLAGAPGCDQRSPQGLVKTRLVSLGGREWQLRLSADPAAVPDAGNTNAWVFSSAGLLSTAMLAALLLTVTGRTRRIEVAVAARTADLQREVGERQRTEAALRESERRFRSIVDHAPVGMAFADLKGRLREANPKLREMLGYGADALSAQSIGDLAHDADRAAIERDLQHLLHGDLPEVQRRTRLRHRDGQTLWVRTHWSLLSGPVAGQDRLVAVIEDITEQAKREEAEQGRQRAEAASLAKNEFLSRMSHELRTPLNAMLGFAQLLDLDRQPAPAAHQKAWIGQILEAGWHLLEMINDTLDLSRIEAGMMRLTLCPLALQPLAAHCMAMAGPAAAQRQVQLQLQLDADASHVLGDETRIKQVLSNLLSNAIKYNHPGGRVELSSRRLPGHRLQIRVLDTGLGLTPAQQAELFQPFNRLGRETSQTEGTGIGLVISRRLAELMGGDLQLESQLGQGATFVFTLPLADAGPDLNPWPAPAAVAPPAGGTFKVHYIEDNETNIEVMRGMLGLRPQVALSVSTLGLDGLQAVRRDRPDLILLDMHLPDVDGLELLHQLQRDPALAGIGVVVLSADATPDRVAQVLAAGAHRYLTKPVDLPPFLALLDSLLGAHRRTTDTPGPGPATATAPEAA